LSTAFEVFAFASRFPVIAGFNPAIHEAPQAPSLRLIMDSRIKSGRDTRPWPSFDGYVRS